MTRSDDDNNGMDWPQAVAISVFIICFTAIIITLSIVWWGY
jgi:hypothetical protein